MRNLLGPYLEGQTAQPLHIAVVGGAGAGKSTVANMLSGAVIAESNPQAGFTRHPIAYQGHAWENTWSAHLGFLGSLRLLDKPAASNLDEDVFQVRQVIGSKDSRVLERLLIWDCPDMTTWAASNYVPRLLEVAGLADIVVYVASDERYNDAVPTQFLEMLLQAGKCVIVCLVKMRESDAPAFIAHFQQEVLARMPMRPAAVLAIPQLTSAQLADPVIQAERYRTPLVQQVLTLATPELRQQAVHAAIRFLRGSQEQLLGVARTDLAALDAWRILVQDGQVEFDSRYRREFLTTERFRRFDEALVKLLQLLELPGIGKYLSMALTVARTPYQMLKGFLNRTLARPVATGMFEKPVLEGALKGWIDLLRKEAAKRSGTHPLWAHITAGFSSGGLTKQIQEHFEVALRGFQGSMNEEVERTARAIYEQLEKNPIALNTLRGTKFALDAGAITATLVAGGINWYDIVLIPLSASVTHFLVESFGSQYVDQQREQARARQQGLVVQCLSAPLADWLANWPMSSGTPYQKLQVALRRIPTSIQQIEVAIQERQGALGKR